MLGVQALCVVALCMSSVSGQQVVCQKDSHCQQGYYCNMVHHVCSECLSCQGLKREPPPAFNTCIKSVAECGSCNSGLVVDRRGDLNAACVPPDTSQLQPTPYYVWLLIGMLLFLAIVVGIIAFILRNPEIFKNAGSNQSSTVTACITATAPEAPPPYNPLHYNAVRTEPPFPSPPYSDTEPTVYNEVDRPFIKRSPPSLPQDARESAGNQAAIVYDKPIYEREPRSPSSESSLPKYNNNMTLTIHDEDTVPSPWIPDGPASNGDVNANGASSEGASGAEGAALPALLAAARTSTLLEPGAKKRCVRQDSNNNRNRESNSCGDGSQNNFPRSPSPSQGGPPYSFITQITNVVQINTTK